MLADATVAYMQKLNSVPYESQTYNIDIDYMTNIKEDKDYNLYFGGELRTESSIDNIMHINDDLISETQSNIIKQIKGVIQNIGKEKVLVKIGENTVIEFPKVLFKDEKLLMYGRSIMYQIKKDEKGFRYQDFIEAEFEQSYLRDEILTELDSF